MVASTKNILIFGATGLIGEHITNAIVANKDKFQRLAIFTSSNTVQTKENIISFLKETGVEIITGDITSVDDVNKAYDSFDTVVSCVGRPVIHTQLQLIQLADKHPDIKRFFPSEYGTDIEYWPNSAEEKPHQQKLKVRALLKDIQNLEYTYVVTGPYGDADGGTYLGAGNPQDDRVGSYDVKRKRAVVIDDGEGKISLTTMRDVGKLVVAALLHPEAVRNRAVKVNSFTTTPNQIVAEYERQTGEKWEVAHTSLDQLKAIESEAWGRGDPRAGAMTLRRIWASGGTLYETRDNGLIGMEDKVDSLEDAVRQGISVQQKAK